MRNLILAGGIVLGTAAAATAGSFTAAPAEPPLMAPAPPMPTAYNWAGGYAGVGLSYGRATHSNATAPEFWPNGSGAGLNGFAGYNWQSGNTVYGVEGHLGTNRMRGSNDVAVPTEIRTELGTVASLRGRVGVAVDRTMFFGTAGLAAGRVTHTAVGLGEETRTANGTVLGVGIEHAISNGLHIRGDLEHYRFRAQDFTTAGIAFDPTRTRANQARVSAVFRF
jgi:outer membrane immunogenic protein